MNSRLTHRPARLAFACALALVGLLSLPASSHASMIGASVDCSITSAASWSCSPVSAFVGAGSEFDLVLSGQTFFDVDFGAWTIDLLEVHAGSLSMGAGETLTFSGIDSIVITGFSLVTSGSVGFTMGDISFTPDSLTIVLSGSQWSPGDSAQITLEGRELAAVPEPASMLLLGSGLAGVAMRARKRRQQQVQ